MHTCLKDILTSREPAGLIDPIELKQSDVRGVEFIPLCLFGLFNPMGPTLAALNMIIKNGAPSGALLYTSLNPFAQTRLITARIPPDTISFFEVFGNLGKVGGGNIMDTLPDFVLPSIEDQDFAKAITDMLLEWVCSTPLQEPLSKINQDYRNNWQDPWNRIPSMEEMIKQVFSGKGKEAVASEPGRDEFIEWVSIVTDMEHVGGELGAIIRSWGGSIQMAGGRSHMPLDEVAKELDALGYPYLNDLA